MDVGYKNVGYEHNHNRKRVESGKYKMKIRPQNYGLNKLLNLEMRVSLLTGGLLSK